MRLSLSNWAVYRELLIWKTSRRRCEELETVPITSNVAKIRSNIQCWAGKQRDFLWKENNKRMETLIYEVAWISWCPTSSTATNVMAHQRPFQCYPDKYSNEFWRQIPEVWRIPTTNHKQHRRKIWTEDISMTESARQAASHLYGFNLNSSKAVSEADEMGLMS